MPGTHWHHDDFLFESQFPTTEQAKNPTAGNELLERFLQRFRRTWPPFVRPLPPRSDLNGTLSGLIFLH